MAEGVPKAALKRAKREGKLTEALEYRLRRSDVAAILGTDVGTVRRWTVQGRMGWVLPCWKTGSGKTSTIMFRIYDVERFARRTNRPFRAEYIPPMERVRWESSRGPLD